MKFRPAQLLCEPDNLSGQPHSVARFVFSYFSLSLSIALQNDQLEMVGDELRRVKSVRWNFIGGTGGTQPVPAICNQHGAEWKGRRSQKRKDKKRAHARSLSDSPPDDR